MKKLCFIPIFSIITLFVWINAYAQDGPKWIAFDPDYPKDYIDINSITKFDKGVVRFWERAGDRIQKNASGKTTFAQYTLREMNCTLKQIRNLKWKMALEDQNTKEGVKALADFLKQAAQIQANYPSPWETIEPDKHSYIRYNFVCKEFQSK
jgi:hypothetical protein